MNSIIQKEDDLDEFDEEEHHCGCSDSVEELYKRITVLEEKVDKMSRIVFDVNYNDGK